MKFKISNTGNPFYNKGENKPLFYNAILAKKWGYDYNQTVQHCKELFINSIFQGATEYNGEIYQVIDYFTYEIIIERAGDKILNNRYVEMRLTNESYAKYYDVINAEYINEGFVKLTIKCDLWVSYFEKIVFDKNKETEINRRLVKRYNEQGSINFDINSDNQIQDNFNAVKTIRTGEPATYNFTKEFLDYSDKPRQPPSKNVDYTKTEYVEPDKFRKLFNVGSKDNPMYFYGIFKSKKGFSNSKFLDIPNNYEIAPILFGEQPPDATWWQWEPPNTGPMTNSWKNNYYDQIARNNNDDLLDIIALPFPPPNYILWRNPPNSKDTEGTPYWTNYQIGTSGDNAPICFSTIGALTGYFDWNNWINEIMGNTFINDKPDTVINKLNMVKDRVKNAKIGDIFNRENEPIFFHTEITDYCIKTPLEKSPPIPLNYVDYKNFRFRYTYNGAFSLILISWLIYNEYDYYKYTIHSSLPSASNAWNDYINKHNSTFLTGIGKTVFSGVMNTIGGGAKLSQGDITGAVSSAGSSLFSILDITNSVKEKKLQADQNHQKDAQESAEFMTVIKLSNNTKIKPFLGSFNWYLPTDNIIAKIIYHCRLFGNPINELQKFKDWSNFQTRIFWDYWEIKNPYFSFELDDIPQGLDDYYNEILKEIRLFPIQDDGTTKLNDYSLENWEIEVIN